MRVALELLGIAGGRASWTTPRRPASVAIAQHASIDLATGTGVIA